MVPRGIVNSSTYDIITMKEGSKVPRRGFIAKRDVLPDPVYNSKIVTRLFTNNVESTIYNSLCYTLLTVKHNVVDKAGNLLGIVNRIRQ